MAAGAAHAEVAALLDGAGTMRLFGLVDPALPELPGCLRARLEGVFSNAYAASLAGADAFVCLAPGDDASFVARLLLDRSLPSVGVRSDRSTSTAGLAGAVERFWQAQVDQVFKTDEIWSRAAMAVPAQAPGDAVVVLTTEPTAPLSLALARLGADVVGAEMVAALSPRYRFVLFILGNTPADSALLALLRRYGGDVVLTESCLLGAHDDGSALALAAAEMGRPVLETELRQWRAGVARPPALLLGDVAAAASRLVVHSGWLAGEIAARYGREAIVLPAATDGRQFCAYATGLWAECCVWAVEMLASWGETVRLDFVCSSSERGVLGDLAARLGVADRIGFDAGLADAALFLAMRGEAGWSGAVARAAACGLPSVASRSVTEAVDIAGAAVLPDQPSPPLLAEAMLRLLPAESAADRVAAAVYRVLRA